MITMYAEIALNSDLIEKIDKSIIESITSENKTNFNPNTPTYGIIAGTGSLVFKDTGRKFVKYSSEGLLTANIPIKIYVKDTISGKKQIVGSWVSKDWKYDVDNDSMRVTLRDDIEDLQDIDVSDTASLINVEDNPITALELFYYLKGGVIKDEEGNDKPLMGITPSKFVFEELDSDVKTLLESINIQIAYLEAGTLWSFYEGLCKLALLYMYKLPNGKIKLDIIR